VASFLHNNSNAKGKLYRRQFSSLSESGFIPTVENELERRFCICKFSSLSESGFIPTHGGFPLLSKVHYPRSHLFQRVASFLPRLPWNSKLKKINKFSSLSESGFIPTSKVARRYAGD